jgi:hypothetical protein
MQDMDAVNEASKAAEAVRALNHATLGGGGYVWPSDVNAVVAELQLAAARMGQALEQAHCWLEQARATGAIGHDQGSDITAARAEWGLRFTAAISVAERLAEELSALQEITAHLTGIDPPAMNSGL